MRRKERNELTSFYSNAPFIEAPGGSPTVSEGLPGIETILTKIWYERVPSQIENKVY
jgi:hypothetical protein